MTASGGILHVEYSGGGYGFISEEKSYAIKMLAKTEGMFIDPVYTGSALACLIDLNQKGFFNEDDVVTFTSTAALTEAAVTNRAAILIPEVP